MVDEAPIVVHATENGPLGTVKLAIVVGAPPACGCDTAILPFGPDNQPDIAGVVVFGDNLRMPWKGNSVLAFIRIVKLDAPVNGFSHAWVADAGDAGTRYRLAESEAVALAEHAKCKAQEK